MRLLDVAKNSPRVASEKQHGAASDNTLNLPNIAVSEFYFWQTITPEANVREAPNLERTVRGIHTIDGGSRPLPVCYVFRASAYDYSWWSIIDPYSIPGNGNLMPDNLQLSVHRVGRYSITTVNVNMEPIKKEQLVNLFHWHV